MGEGGSRRLTDEELVWRSMTPHPPLRGPPCLTYGNPQNLLRAFRGTPSLFGHGSALTPHWGVIHPLAAASLPTGEGFFPLFFSYINKSSHKPFDRYVGTSCYYVFPVKNKDGSSVKYAVIYELHQPLIISTISSPILLCASTVCPPICGVTDTFG